MNNEESLYSLDDAREILNLEKVLQKVVCEDQSFTNELIVVMRKYPGIWPDGFLAEIEEKNREIIAKAIELQTAKERHVPGPSSFHHGYAFEMQEYEDECRRYSQDIVNLTGQKQVLEDNLRRIIRRYF